MVERSGRSRRACSSNLALALVSGSACACKTLREYDQQQCSKEEGEVIPRDDLSHIPCVCIDSHRIRFRDNAIGIRPRIGARARGQEGSSKWEMLIHIADVTDIYSSPTERRCYETRLKQLHLLQPTVLEQLTLDKSPRAITICVSIDETIGNIVDYGIEQTLVSKPIMYTYEQASNVLSENTSYTLCWRYCVESYQNGKSGTFDKHRGSTRSPGHISGWRCSGTVQSCFLNLRARSQGTYAKILLRHYT